MANKDIFSKHLKSNVKLATRYDAEGREVQVERREDADATVKEQETFDMLIKAGYYRACIKGLSAFDKVVGGMTWCIECCDYDVDVDLLFHENLTIGQKISLVEKIVAVLPQMQCPFLIEPHQIQGLEFLSIHPVIQWLVKKSVENRAERNQHLKRFAISQFHNNYQYKSDKENLEKMRKASSHIERTQEINHPVRQYQRKVLSDEDEKTRVRMTLLEYGHQLSKSNSCQDVENTDDSLKDSVDKELDVEKLFQNLVVTNEHAMEPPQKFDNATRLALKQHYQEFEQEMESDVKELTEQNQVKTLEAAELELQRKLECNQNKAKEVSDLLQKETVLLEKKVAEHSELAKEIEEYTKLEENVEPSLLQKVQSLLKLHDELEKEELEYRVHHRKDLEKLEIEIVILEELNTQNRMNVEREMRKENIQLYKKQLAKRNRDIVTIQRQLDDIPDRTELAQYQRRFHELYNEMSSKHLETKQYYTLYNTLNDQKRYMEKEISLLDSICEAYNKSMMTSHGREDFIQKFDEIVNEVKQTEQKVKAKYNSEKARRELLNEELQSLLELQRQYAAAVKQLTRECKRCEELQHHLQSIRKK